jgi:hypothetical protein
MKTYANRKPANKICYGPVIVKNKKMHDYFGGLKSGLLYMDLSNK